MNDPSTEHDPAETPSQPRSSQAKEKSADLQNQILDDFRLLRRIGKGGMAEVYLAEQISLKRQVAVKVLRADMLDEKDHVLIKRFEQEATAAGGLVHPNIVQVYMVGNKHGIHYIAQEYIQGMNLREYLLKKGPPDVPMALHIIRQTCAALQMAGEAGIVHRDIKPENIMLTRKGEAKVADFGLAQLSRNPEGVNLTQVGMTMGTPLYMSPEQINGKKVDPRSDIYSLGVTCYHMLSGRPPFDGDSPLTIAVKHLNETPPKLKDLRPDVPNALIRIVEKAMSRDPEDRYQDAGEMLKDVKALIKQLKEDPGEVEMDLANLDTSDSLGSMTSLIPPNFSRLVMIYLGCLFPVLLISAGIGWVMRTEDPMKIAPKEDVLQIAEQDSAERQYLQAAASLDSLEEWKAVVKLFPDDPEFTPKAKYRIASLTLESGQLQEAEAILKDLSLMGDATAQAVADAGNAILLYEKKQYSEAKSRIVALNNRGRLPEEMAELLKIVETKLNQ